MPQIKLTKDATLIFLCCLNYSSSLAVNQSACHRRAFLTPLHLHSLHTLIILQDLSKYCKTFFISFNKSANLLSRRKRVCRVSETTEIPSMVAALTSITAVVFVWKRGGGKRHWCKNSWGAQAADNLISSCSIDILFPGMLREINMTLPPPHAPLKLNYWYSATKSS